MAWMPHAIIALVLVDFALVATLATLPTPARAGSYRALCFVALFFLPSVITGLGISHHLEQAKTTEFCVSCHVMEPYGQSLLIDDPSYLPAVHYQNNLTPRETACYDCHTNYAMFGDIEAKLAGVAHLFVYYSGRTPEKIELYRPYRNRECLHCHGPSRSFTEGDLHADMLDELRSEEISCLECHDAVHAVHEAESLDFWPGSAEEEP